MDLIWLSTLTICLNLCINRSLGHLRGWRRLLHWPLMHLAALTVYFMLASVPLVALLRWQAAWTGIKPWTIDLTLTAIAAVLAAAWLRWFIVTRSRGTLKDDLGVPQSAWPDSGT